MDLYTKNKQTSIKLRLLFVEQLCKLFLKRITYHYNRVSYNLQKILFVETVICIRFLLEDYCLVLISLTALSLQHQQFQDDKWALFFSNHNKHA